MATRIKQLSSKYTVILTRFPMSQSFESCYIWRLLFCFVLQALSPVMTTLKTLKCSSNWRKCLFVTQSIHFGNHNLEIHSDVSEFTGHYDEKFCFNENLNKFHQKFIMLCSEWLKKQQWKLPPQISSIEQKKCYLEIDHIFLYPKPINTNLRRLVQYYYIISYIESHRALIRLPKLL